MNRSSRRKKVIFSDFLAPNSPVRIGIFEDFTK